LTGSAPANVTSTFPAASGGVVLAGNVGLSFPPGGFNGVSDNVTVSITSDPADAPIPGGPAQFSPNGTIFQIKVTDSAGSLITSSPAPVTLVMKYNGADVAMARGNPRILTAAYVIGPNTPDFANPLHLPIGTFVLFPASSVVVDPVAGTISVETQLIDGVFAAMANPLGYVQVVSSDAAVYSSFDPATSQEFGRRAQFAYLRVVEPQIGDRLLVVDPTTDNYAFVSAVDVGPSGSPSLPP
jgi:hypothetical protein